MRRTQDSPFKDSAAKQAFPLALEVRGVSHSFGKNRILQNINLEIESGQIVSLVGPSGCGKSTLLRAILGTHPPKEGQVRTNGHLVCAPNRDVGIVYQHYSLYDFLTVEQNVAFGLMLDETNLPFRVFAPWKWWPMRRRHLVLAREYLAKVHLPQAAKLYPHEVSGGMKQRVAIAQALVMKPQILLLDEPFGALDEATREELQVMLLELYQENVSAKSSGNKPPFTILIVTHELNEAIYVADRVIGVSQYHSEGKNGATIVYDKPAPIFLPQDAKDFARFAEQREELRSVVFDPERIQHRDEFVSFWKDRSLAIQAKSLSQ